MLMLWEFAMKSLKYGPHIEMTFRNNVVKWGTARDAQEMSLCQKISYYIKAPIHLAEGRDRSWKFVRVQKSQTMNDLVIFKFILCHKYLSKIRNNNFLICIKSKRVKVKFEAEKLHTNNITLKDAEVLSKLSVLD